MRRLSEALRSRDFRLYVGAQFLHGAGVWTHRIAELWLVYEITGAALSVGFATAVRAGSSVVLAPLAGVLADRVDRRRLLTATQSVKAVVAGGLAVGAVAMGSDVPLWFLYTVIAALGVVGAVDIPLRRAFVRDVVSVGGLEGAARLHTPVMASGRIFGSALAALLLSWSAPWACFAWNGAASALAALLVFSVSPAAGVRSCASGTIDGYETSEKPDGSEKPETSDGSETSEKPDGSDLRLLGYLRRTPAVAVPLGLLLCFASFGWNVDVLIPVLADRRLHAGPGAFGTLVSAMSVGILCGSLTAAVGGRSGLRPLGMLLAAFGVTLVPLGAVGHISAGLVAFWLVGASGGGFLSLANSAVQVAVDPRLQGRVAAAYGVVVVGSRTVGGPLLGWMADVFGSRTTLAVVGLGTACLAGAALVLISRHPLR